MSRTAAFGGYPARPAGLYPIVRGVVDVSGVPEEHTHIQDEFLANLAQPFVGLTVDGRPRPELFPLEETGLSTAEAADRARRFLSLLDDGQRERATRPVDSDRWRAWINAFPPAQPHGLLLDDAETPVREAAMAVLEALLSPAGFGQVRDTMRINAALGEIAPGYEDTLREWMYWFCVFGDPSPDGAWGVQLFGHHVCLHVLVVGGQIAVGPVFLGAEPRVVVSGRHAGIRAFDAEIERAVELMRLLTPAQREKATLSGSIQWADLPPELAHPTEGRMRGSAARDNAVVPYEGVSGREMDVPQREALRALIAVYAGRLPSGHAQLRIRDVDEHLDETHFAWVGEVDVDAPFYYKVHGPVIFVELDAHSGIFLANDDPEPFHIHNIVRTPNGNDYGRAYLDQLARRRD